MRLARHVRGFASSKEGLVYPAGRANVTVGTHVVEALKRRETAAAAHAEKDPLERKPPSPFVERKLSPASPARNLLPIPSKLWRITLGPSMIGTCLGLNQFKPRAELMVELWAKNSPETFAAAGGLTPESKFKQVSVKPVELEETAKKMEVVFPDALENFKASVDRDDVTLTLNTASSEFLAKAVAEDAALAQVSRQLSVEPQSVTPEQKEKFLEEAAKVILKQVAASKTGTALTSINLFKSMLQDVDKMNAVERALASEVVMSATVPYEEMQALKDKVAASQTKTSGDTQALREEVAAKLQALEPVAQTQEDRLLTERHLTSSVSTGFGTRNEDVAAQDIAKTTARELNIDKKFYSRHILSKGFSGLPFDLVGRIDRITLDPADGKPWIHEIKNRTRGLLRNIPVVELYQVQAYMYLTGVHRAEWTQHYNGSYQAKHVFFNEREWMDDVLPKIRTFCLEMDELLFTERAQVLFRQANAKYFKKVAGGARR